MPRSRARVIDALLPGPRPRLTSASFELMHDVRPRPNANTLTRLPSSLSVERLVARPPSRVSEPPPLPTMVRTHAANSVSTSCPVATTSTVQCRVWARYADQVASTTCLNWLDGRSCNSPRNPPTAWRGPDRAATRIDRTARSAACANPRDIATIDALLPTRAPPREPVSRESRRCRRLLAAAEAEAKYQRPRSRPRWIALTDSHAPPAHIIPPIMRRPFRSAPALLLLIAIAIFASAPVCW